MTIPAGLTVGDDTVDLLVVGTGTGMAAALAAHEAGLRVLIVEKSSYVGGSTARSGGALWLPGSQVMRDDGAADSTQRAQVYLDAVVDGTASEERSTAYLPRLRPGVMEATIPMPTTGADYRWLNLVSRVPRKGLPIMAKRLGQGAGGLLLGRRYAAGGQALAAGLFAGVLRAGIPVWTDTSLVRINDDGARVTGAVVSHGGNDFSITA